jgi:hypothetical protein
MKDVSLVNYFHEKLSSLKISDDFESLLSSIFSRISKTRVLQMKEPKFKIMTQEETFRVKLKTISQINVDPNDIQSLEKEIEKKYSYIRELEKRIESAREKIEIIDEYQQYLEDYRKPGIIEKVETINYYLDQKKSSISYLNLILEEKNNLNLNIGEIVSKIQDLYKEIEDDDKIMNKMTEVLESSQIEGKKQLKLKQNDSFCFSKFLEESNNTILEISDENTKNEISSKIEVKNEISSSRSQVMIMNLFFNPESSSPSEISHSSKKHLSLKIHDLKKIPVDNRKTFSNNLPNPTKSPKIKLPELSRTNQERLAIIEGRLRYGEVLHNHISPTLERVKRFEKEKKNYFLPSSRNNYSHSHGGYKSMSPRPGFNNSTHIIDYSKF